MLVINTILAIYWIACLVMQDETTPDWIKALRISGLVISTSAVVMGLVALALA